MEIRYVKEEDSTFWFSLDKHITIEEFNKKIRDNMGYIVTDENEPIGLMRYNLFWDNIPFCTMLFVDFKYQKRGYGRELMLFWEKEMKRTGYGMLMTSTQVNESAQHFYRKIGYREVGGFVIEIPRYAQPMEMIMIKEI